MQILRRRGVGRNRCVTDTVVVVPLTVPVPPPAHVTTHPEPHPVIVHAAAEHATVHDEVSEQSTFALDARSPHVEL